MVSAADPYTEIYCIRLHMGENIPEKMGKVTLNLRIKYQSWKT
jgi:hypothetical protein